jgi:adenylate cyclase, class 2
MGDSGPREIEVKFRLDGRSAFEGRLAAAGARREGTESETNVLFDDRAGTLKAAGCALRLRTTERGALLTFKGKASFSGGVKSRLELESAVGKADAVSALLAELGYAPRFTYEKRRTTWRFQDPSQPLVVVDETPLGLFAEIEGTDAAVRALASAFGIPESAFIAESYVGLWMKARDADPTLPEDMLFRASG